MHNRKEYMKNINRLIGGGVLATFVVVSSAVAKDGVYVGVGIGSAGMGESETKYTDRVWAGQDTTIEYKAGLSTSFLVGYKISSFRADVEIFSHSNDFGKASQAQTGREWANITGESSASTLLISGYYDFKVKNPKFTPYIGAGVGSTTFKYTEKISNNTLTKDDEKVSSFAITGGLDYAINDKLSIGGAYRLINYGDIKIKDIDNDEVTISTDMSSAFIFSAKYRF